MKAEGCQKEVHAFCEHSQQSGGLWVGDKPRLFITWNRYEIWRPQSFDVREQSKTLASELEGLGFDVTTEERLDGAGWRSWSAQAAHALQATLSDRR